MINNILIECHNSVFERVFPHMLSVYEFRKCLLLFLFYCLLFFFLLYGKFWIAAVYSINIKKKYIHDAGHTFNVLLVLIVLLNIYIFFSMVLVIKIILFVFSFQCEKRSTSFSFQNMWINICFQFWLFLLTKNGKIFVSFLTFLFRSNGFQLNFSRELEQYPMI